MSEEPMTSGWYYAKAGPSAGQEIGPLSWELLYSLAQTGTISPADLVWHPKLSRGVEARLIPGLFLQPQSGSDQTHPVKPVAEPLALTRMDDNLEEDSIANPEISAERGIRLPLLVVLLVLILAIAGVTVYFLYLRP